MEKTGTSFQKSDKIELSFVIPTEILGHPATEITKMSQLAVALVLQDENYEGKPPNVVISSGSVLLNDKPIAGCYDRTDRLKPNIRIGEKSLNEVWGTKLLKRLKKLRSLTTLFIVSHETKHFVDDQRGILVEGDPNPNADNSGEHYSYQCEMDALETSCKTVNKAIGTELFIPSGKGQIKIKFSLLNLYLLANDERIYKRVLKRFPKRYQD